MKALGHDFHENGDEEMICHACDFVIWRVGSPAEAECAVTMINGAPYLCPAEAREAIASGTETRQGEDVQQASSRSDDGPPGRPNSVGSE